MDYALIAIAALLPAYLIRFSFFGLPTTLLEMMILSATAAWTTRIIQSRGRESVFLQIFFTNKKKPISIRILRSVIGAFMAAGLISIVIAPNILAAAGLYRAYVIEPLLVFVLCVDTLKTRTHFFGVLSAMILSAWAVSLGALIQYATGWGIPGPWIAERRTTSIYPYPNAVGLFVAPLVPLMVTLCLHIRLTYRKRLARNFFVGLLFLGVAVSAGALVVSKTEGAILALLGVAIVAGLFWVPRARYRTLWLVSVGIAVIVVSPPLSQFVSSKLLFKDDSGRVRRIMWRESTAMLADRWVLGAGLAGYQRALVPYHNPKKGIEIYMYPHTIVMNFLTELGLLGLLSFAAIVGVAGSMLVSLLRYAQTRSSHVRTVIRLYAYGLISFFGVVLIHGLVDVPYFKNDLAVQFWMVVALSLVAYIYRETLTQEI